MIVIKNSCPACILMSPKQHESLMEMLSDHIMQEEAESRMAHYNPEESLSQEAMMKELDITPEELEGIEVEIE